MGRPAIDLREFCWISNVGTGGGSEEIDVSPACKEVGVGSRAAKTVAVLDVVSLKVLATLESKSFSIRIKFAPGGKFALNRLRIRRKII